jgi:hypothetical protein
MRTRGASSSLHHIIDVSTEKSGKSGKKLAAAIRVGRREHVRNMEGSHSKRRSGEPLWRRTVEESHHAVSRKRDIGVFGDRQAGMAGIKACRLCRPIAKNITWRSAGIALAAVSVIRSSPAKTPFISLPCADSLRIRQLDFNKHGWEATHEPPTQKTGGRPADPFGGPPFQPVNSAIGRPGMAGFKASRPAGSIAEFTP